MPDVTFTEFTNDYRVPGTRVEIRAAYQNAGVAEYPARILAMVPAPVGASGAMNTPIRCSRGDEAAALAGGGTIADKVLRTARRANTSHELWMILVPDPTTGATAPTATFVFSGTPSAAGTMGLYVEDRRYILPVGTTDTANILALRAKALMDADSACAATTAVTSGTLTLTHKHKGVLGQASRIDINLAREEATPSGLSCVLTQFGSGAGAHDVTAAIAAIQTMWFTSVISAFSDSTNIGLLSAEMDRRYTALAHLDGRCYWSAQATFGTLIAAGAAQNGRFMTRLPCYQSATPPWAWAASLAGVMQLSLANNPAQQMRGSVLPGVMAPPTSSRAIESEREQMLRNGDSTFTVTDDGSVVLERIITMNQRTSLGIADASWLDVMTPETLSRVRYDWRNYRETAWARHGLAPDGSPAATHADAVLTPQRAKAAWAARMGMYERQGWIVNAKADAQAATFSIDPNNRNRLIQRAPLTIMGALMLLDTVLEFQA